MKNGEILFINKLTTITFFQFVQIFFQIFENTAAAATTTTTPETETIIPPIVVEPVAAAFLFDLPILSMHMMLNSNNIQYRPPVVKEVENKKAN